MLLADNRTVVAVHKHIVAEGALAGGDEGIGAEEAAEIGVVISGLEIVKPGFCVLWLATEPIM